MADTIPVSSRVPVRSRAPVPSKSQTFSLHPEAFSDASTTLASPLPSSPVPDLPGFPSTSSGFQTSPIPRHPVPLRVVTDPCPAAFPTPSYHFPPVPPNLSQVLLAVTHRVAFPHSLLPPPGHSPPHLRPSRVSPIRAPDQTQSCKTLSPSPFPLLPLRSGISHQ